MSIVATTSQYGSAALAGHLSALNGKYSEHEPTAFLYQCWEHGCNGRGFSSVHDLLGHQREALYIVPRRLATACSVEFRRSEAWSRRASPKQAPALRQQRRNAVSNASIKKSLSNTLSETITQLVDGLSTAHISDVPQSATSSKKAASFQLLTAGAAPSSQAGLPPPSPSRPSLGLVRRSASAYCRPLSRSQCPRCGANFSRDSARTLHLASGQCPGRKQVGKRESSSTTRYGAVSSSRITKSRSSPKPVVRFAHVIEEISGSRKCSGAFSQHMRSRSDITDISPLTPEPVSSFSEGSAASQLQWPPIVELHDPCLSAADESACLESFQFQKAIAVTSACPHCNTNFASVVERTEHFVSDFCPALNQQQPRRGSLGGEVGIDVGSTSGTAAVSTSCAPPVGQDYAMTHEPTSMDSGMDIDPRAVPREGRAATCGPFETVPWA